MKQKTVYSRANGAFFILLSLILIVCCIDTSSWISSIQSRITTFGKTHFIVGYPHESEPISSSGGSADNRSLAHDASTIKRVLFSPDDDLQHELIALINKERKTIKIAIYTFTDKEVAKALLEARKRGVRVEVIADGAYLYGAHSKISLLEEQGIPIFTYNPHYDNQETQSIMHNKFVIFGENLQQRSLVWTGSFNFTRSATKRNQENVIILDDSYTVSRYLEQFDRLKHRCKNCNRSAIAQVVG